MGTSTVGRISLRIFKIRPSFDLIYINTLPHKTFEKIQHRVYPHYKHSNASIFNVQKHIAKHRFRKSRENTTCVPSYQQSRVLAVENEETNVQDSLWAEDGDSRENCIVESCKQEENSSAFIYNQAEVISGLCCSGNERPAKRIFALLNAEIFGLNEIPETQKNVLAYIRFGRETGNECLETEWISKYTCVNWMNRYNHDIKWVPKERDRGPYESGKSVRRRGPPLVAYTSKKCCKHPIKTTHCSQLESWTEYRIPCNGSQKVLWDDDCTTFRKKFAWFVQMFPGKTASSLEGSALVAYPLQAVLHSFSDAYKCWAVQSGHNLVAFFPVGCGAEQQAVNNILTDMKEPIRWYS